MPTKQQGGGKGRRRLDIRPGFGRFVFEAMSCHRRDDGTAWGTADLGQAVGVRAATVRDWIAGGNIDADNLTKLAAALDLPVGQLAEARVELDLSHQDRARLVELYARMLDGLAHKLAALEPVTGSGTGVAEGNRRTAEGG